MNNAIINNLVSISRPIYEIPNDFILIDDYKLLSEYNIGIDNTSNIDKVLMFNNINGTLKISGFIGYFEIYFNDILLLSTSIKRPITSWGYSVLFMKNFDFISNKIRIKYCNSKWLLQYI